MIEQLPAPSDMLLAFRRPRGTRLLITRHWGLTVGLVGLLLNPQVPRRLPLRDDAGREKGRCSSPEFVALTVGHFFTGGHR
jgi:hypothetical protein